jgi:MerR family transcriptional regulator, light-induced transcriptional regulator
MVSPNPPAPTGRTQGSAEEAFLEEGLVAVRSLNAAALEEVLHRAAVAFGHQGLLRRVLAPLVQMVGELWRQGAITAAHEHFASALVRAFLTTSVKPFAAGGERPNLVIATPAGQLHELGAVLVSATAVSGGWAVTYLGASLPAAEIAGAALQSRARAVALSIVYPEDDAGLGPELEKLRSYLPPETAILVGGRAALAYRKVLEKIGARVCCDLDELDRGLASLRRH